MEEIKVDDGENDLAAKVPEREKWSELITFPESTSPPSDGLLSLNFNVQLPDEIISQNNLEEQLNKIKDDEGSLIERLNAALDPETRRLSASTWDTCRITKVCDLDLVILSTDSCTPDQFCPYDTIVPEIFRGKGFDKEEDARDECDSACRSYQPTPPGFQECTVSVLHWFENQAGGPASCYLHDNCGEHTQRLNFAVCPAWPTLEYLQSRVLPVPNDSFKSEFLQCSQ